MFVYTFPWWILSLRVFTKVSATSSSVLVAFPLLDLSTSIRTIGFRNGRLPNNGDFVYTKVIDSNTGVVIKGWETKLLRQHLRTT